MFEKVKPCSTPSEAQVPPSSAANSWTDAPASWNSTHTSAMLSSPVGRSSQEKRPCASAELSKPPFHRIPIGRGSLLV